MPHSFPTRRSSDLVDRRVAADRQLRRAVHRVRARAAALEDVAVLRGRHAQLLLQDAGGGRADPAAVSGACGHPALSGRGTRDRAASARGRGLSLQAGSPGLARSDGKTSRLEALPQGTGPRGGSMTFGPSRGRVIGRESGFAIAPGHTMTTARPMLLSLAIPPPPPRAPPPP